MNKSVLLILTCLIILSGCKTNEEIKIEQQILSIEKEFGSVPEMDGNTPKDPRLLEELILKIKYDQPSKLKLKYIGYEGAIGMEYIMYENNKIFITQTNGKDYISSFSCENIEKIEAQYEDETYDEYYFIGCIAGDEKRFITRVIK